MHPISFCYYKIAILEQFDVPMQIFLSKSWHYSTSKPPDDIYHSKPTELKVSKSRTKWNWDMAPIECDTETSLDIAGMSVCIICNIF